MWLDALSLLGLRIRAPVCTYLLTYLRSRLWAYKTGIIPETVEDRAKVTINDLYKVVHTPAFDRQMYVLE